WQHGEKAGISQATNGRSNIVKEEKTDAFEIGLKSLLLNNTLVFNIDIFQMDIKDYQQTGRIKDDYTTENNHRANPNDINTYYTNATINVPEVRAKGIEIDGIYSGIENISLRFSGAYNDAKYVDFTTSAQPSENGYASAPPYRDVSGKTLPGAAKYTFNIGADYRLPVFDNKEFHASFNTLYSSKYNSDVSLSSYGWIPSRTTTDLGVGIGSIKQTYDFSLIVKNAFDDDTPQAETWNNYNPAVSRWVALNFSGKF
ncbi:MAG: TonB-dependent receptor, partial [Chitinophagaceae bacterium]